MTIEILRLLASQKEFSWFTFYLGEITLYRNKNEFKSIAKSSILKMKDVKKIDLIIDIDPNEINKTWTIEDGIHVPFDDNDDDDDDETRKWFIRRAEEFEFHPLMQWCTMCGKHETCYNGITRPINGHNSLHNGTIFQFCKICRDELVMLASLKKKELERIGA
jgi:hypothetical protein